MIKFGLLGKKLGHSYSPRIHNLLYGFDYSLYEKDEDQLEDFFSDGLIKGMNVTIPYKKEVMKYLTRISETAKEIGSVNTIIKTDSGYEGHNTDYYGFMYMVNTLKVDAKGKKVIVLGSGGAAQTVIYYFKKALAREIIVISRNGENNYENLYKHYDADIIVNCTPVGMYPDNLKSPVDLSPFSKLSGVLDLIYNPAETALILQAKEKNIPCINGLTMLVAQAKASAEIFLGTKIPDEKIEEITKILNFEMKNIVLVGMPGCGKTTLGKVLAHKLGRNFYDADIYLEQKYKTTIPTIFKKYGEEKFREMETEVLDELSKKSSAVISTGGGAVTQERNYNIIRQNSNVIWIKRDNSLLDTKDRPISQSMPREEIYKKREPLYNKFAHFSVLNMGTIDQCADDIINKLNYLEDR